MRLLLHGWALGALLTGTALLHADVGNLGPWGDQGNGTYRNPVLHGDFGDPDVVRLYEAYYLVASTAQYAPGLAILTSADLVNWDYVGHAVDDVPPSGIEAGGLRRHEGKFFLYFSQGGVPYVTTAAEAAGPWTPPRKVWDGDGNAWTSPSPFWDDDGQGWLTMSVPDSGLAPGIDITLTKKIGVDLGSKGGTHLFKLSADGLTLDTASDRLLDDSPTGTDGKLYRIGGAYYFLHGELRPDEGRVAVMLRAKSLAGPWEKKVILHGGRVADREPSAGALVEAPDKSWWVLAPQSRGGYDGHPLHLLPVTWTDGWPLPGTVDAGGVGTLQWSHAKPPQPNTTSSPASPSSDDDFSAPKLAPQWEWNHPPRAAMWSLAENPGHLRLKAFKPLPVSIEPKLDPAQLGGQFVQLIRSFLNASDFFRVGNVVTQRTMGPGPGEVVVRVEVAGMADGQIAGLALYWERKYVATLGIVEDGGVRRVEFANTLTRKNDAGPEMSAGAVWLRASIVPPPAVGKKRDSGADAPTATFSYSFDGRNYTTLGDPFRFGGGPNGGTRLALFTWNGRKEAGYADFGPFRYVYFGTSHPDADAFATPNYIP